MEQISQIIGTVNNLLYSYVLIALLLALGTYFSIKTGFIQVRYVGEMFRLLGGKIQKVKTESLLSKLLYFNSFLCRNRKPCRSCHCHSNWRTRGSFLDVAYSFNWNVFKLSRVYISSNV